MLQMGFTLKEIQESLSENRYDEVCATYMLLKRDVKEVSGSWSGTGREWDLGEWGLGVGLGGNESLGLGLGGSKILAWVRSWPGREQFSCGVVKLEIRFVLDVRFLDYEGEWHWNFVYSCHCSLLFLNWPLWQLQVNDDLLIGTSLAVTLLFENICLALAECL